MDAEPSAAKSDEERDRELVRLAREINLVDDVMNLTTEEAQQQVMDGVSEVRKTLAWSLDECRGLSSLIDTDRQELHVQLQGIEDEINAAGERLEYVLLLLGLLFHEA